MGMTDPDCELTILIPCLNEEKTIGYCVHEAFKMIRKLGVIGEVLVIDNGSHDSSAIIAKGAGANLVTESKKGYGNAIISGIKFANGKYAIMADGDGSYCFLNSEMIFNLLKFQKIDLVTGNRFLGGIEKGAMPMLHKCIGVPILTWTINLLYDLKIGDGHCGHRGFRVAPIRMLDLRAPGMEFASEMLIKAKLKGLSIQECPVTLRPDGRKGPSHLRTFRDGFRHLGIILYYTPKLPLIKLLLLILPVFFIFLFLVLVQFCVLYK